LQQIDASAVAQLSGDPIERGCDLAQAQIAYRRGNFDAAARFRSDRGFGVLLAKMPSPIRRERSNL